MIYVLHVFGRNTKASTNMTTTKISKKAAREIAKLRREMATTQSMNRAAQIGRRLSELDPEWHRH